MRPNLPRVGGQVIEEWDIFIEKVKALNPTSYLEVGARDGICLRYLVERIPSITRVGVVEWPEKEWGRHGSLKKLNDNLEALEVHVDLYLGNSQDSVISDKVAKNTYDVIFIDADHSYIGIKTDYEIYAPLANMMVAMHDINHPPDSKAYGPTKLWIELGGTESIIAETSRTGIGVIRVRD